MSVAFSRAEVGREYVCDSCGSAVAGIAVYRKLLGEPVAGRIWSGLQPPSEGKPLRCGFCFSAMQPRSVEGGLAAICRSCQVMWLDKVALESQTSKISPLRLSQIGVARCGHCGAAVSSPLDRQCRFCKAAFTVEPRDVVLPNRRRGDTFDEAAEVVFFFARAVVAVLDWSTWW
jgi:hypothetical protein